MNYLPRLKYIRQQGLIFMLVIPPPKQVVFIVTPGAIDGQYRQRWFQ